MALRRMLLLLAAGAVVGAGGQGCSRSAPRYAVVASRGTPEAPWEAALDAVGRAPAQLTHFAVRPARKGPVERLSVTLRGRIPLGELVAAEQDYERVAVAGGERWYKAYVARATWAEARAACEVDGAHLVVMETAAEAAAVSAWLAKADPKLSLELHAGFFAKDYADNFFTIDGLSLSAAGYAGWGPGQPDMSICGRIDRGGRLRDGMCDWVEPASFVCEREPNPGISAPVGGATGTISAPTAVPSRSPPGPRPGYGYGLVEPYGGQSLYKLHASPATWWEAGERCVAEGARLAVLESAAEAKVPAELVRRSGRRLLPYLYVGARAHLRFFTVFGEPVPDDLWAPDYPAFQNCVATDHNGTLWVTQCWAKYPFVCEYSVH